MSENWNPPPGRPPHEPGSDGQQPPEPDRSGRREQSPQWWTQPTEEPDDFLAPGQPHPYQHPAPPVTGPQYQPGQPPQGQYPPQGPQAPWQYPAQQPPPPYPGQQPGRGEPPYPPMMAQIPIPLPPGGGRGRKPRRTSKALLIGLVVLAVVAVAGGVTVVVQNLGDDTTPTAGADVSTTPSETPTPTPTPTPTVKPTPKPKPKPKPKPPTPTQVVAQNKLYVTGRMLASRCPEPSFRPTTPDATRAYYVRLLPCLNKSWYPTIKKAGYRYRSPKVVVFAGTLTTPCGRVPATNAYYCGSSETIYMPWALDNEKYKANQDYARAWMANTFAHEYGHHVQMMTGILSASFQRQGKMPSTAAKLQESRRRELQAACLGSAYLGTNRTWIPMTGALLSSWQFAVRNAGDEFNEAKVRDHGNKVNHAFWSFRGYNSRNPGLCNTFTASVQVTN